MVYNNFVLTLKCFSVMLRYSIVPSYEDFRSKSDNSLIFDKQTAHDL